MTYIATREFGAPAEVVFGTATDPARWDRWLPPEVRLEPMGDQRVRVTWPGGARTVRWQAEGDDFRLTTEGPARWSGTLAVSPGGAGGSTARLELAGEHEWLVPAAERALAYLDDQVADNFTAG
jgi:uncharacterized protein YndB with AHSA1/START domain